MKRPIIHVLTLCVLLCPSVLHSEGSETIFSPSSRLQKTQTLKDGKAILINDLFTYFTNNGVGASNPFTGDCGLELKSNGGQTMYAEGLLWGGYARGAIKVGGGGYFGGLQAGPIITPGTSAALPVAANPANSRYRIYRVRPDVPVGAAFGQVETLLTRQEVSYLTKYEPSATARSVYDQYVRDWNEWPGAEGAPYTDVNHNGVYEPEIDIPGVPGAGQTLWYVANDMDSLCTKPLYGSLPIGIEMQRTIWAYQRAGALNTAIFQRSRIINKSGLPIDSMYITQFTDPEIGGSLGNQDDYAGCDTLRNMGYAYNATNNDVYFHDHSPAVGLMLLAGPAVPASGTDSAYVNFTYRRGYRNLPMTSMVYIFKNYEEPHMGVYSGTQEFYNVMRGRLISGNALINTETGKTTTFVFPGDPITQAGWVEGDPYPYKLTTAVFTPADRRMSFTSGPFTMAPADTQDILIAEMVGMGSDNMGSLAALRSNADAVRKIFRGGFSLPAIPTAPVVHASGWNGRILLDWTDAASYSAAEAYASAGYTFQGYNLYQLPNGDFTKAKRLLTSDIIDDVRLIVDTVYDPAVNLFYPKTTAYGANTGLRHYFISSTDSLTGMPMVNGTKYWYAVTSYAYNPAASGGMKMLESTPAIFEVTPQQPLPGITLPAVPGQVISHDQSRVLGTDVHYEIAVVSVIDPVKITGHLYVVRFAGTASNAPWSVFDSTANKVVIPTQTQYAPFSYIPGSTFNFANVPTDPIADGLQFSAVTGHVHSSTQWLITTAGLEPKPYSQQQAAADMQHINVYPNPYFAGNVLESNKYEHFVTFNHLPQKAVINILTLTGVRVKAIVKNDPSQFLKWDLTNESGAQVAAGMYVVYISLPDLGTQKILKLAVIPAVTIPDHW
jgi:hypothetical protein